MIIAGTKFREYRTIVRHRDDGDADVLAAFVWDVDETTSTLAEFDAMVDTVRRWFDPAEAVVLERQDLPDVITPEEEEVDGDDGDPYDTVEERERDRPEGDIDFSPDD